MQSLLPGGRILIYLLIYYLLTLQLINHNYDCEIHVLTKINLRIRLIFIVSQELLNVDSNKHPILFLKDVKYNELKALIQYMYRGEVNILQDELSSLLAVAEALKIKGLADIEPSDDSITSETIILSEQRPRKKANKPNRPAPPAVPIASSGLQITRSLPQLQQGYTFPTTSQTSYSSSPPASGTKKPRTDTQSHKQQEVDPLLNVQVQHTTITPSKRKINYEMVGNQNKSTGYYDATHRSDAIDYAGEIMIIEEPETFVPRAVSFFNSFSSTYSLTKQIYRILGQSGGSHWWY